jgi:hypothetical protein
MMNLKRFAALSLAAVLTFAQPITALADNAVGTGHVLSFEEDTVVVPTTLKIALNPDQFDLPILKEQLTSVPADEATFKQGKYFKKEVTGAYTPVSADSFSAITSTNVKTFYKAKATSDQIISLNYGIANRSKNDKRVKVTIKATPKNNNTSGSNNAEIEFVDAAAKANANTCASTELKMFLAIASANNSATPSAMTMEKKVITSTSQFVSALNAATTAGVEALYTKDFTTMETRHSAAYSVITDAEIAVTKGAVYARTTDIGADVRAAELGDVVMTPVTSYTTSAIFAGTGSNIKGEVGYKLDKAAYKLVENPDVDFDTTTQQFQNEVELDKLGGYTSFTLTGAVNSNGNWAASKSTEIDFTAIYKFEDADGEETAISGTRNEIGVDAFDEDETETTYALARNNSNGALIYTFDAGSKPTGSLTGFTVTVNGTTTVRDGQVTNGNVTYDASSGFFKIVQAGVTACGITQNQTTIVATIGGQTYTFTY